MVGSGPICLGTGDLADVKKIIITLHTYSYLDRVYTPHQNLALSITWGGGVSKMKNKTIVTFNYTSVCIQCPVCIECFTCFRVMGIKGRTSVWTLYRTEVTRNRSWGSWFICTVSRQNSFPS